MLSSTDIYLGASATWFKAQGEIDALAPSDLPLVLLGPTGCGKSVLAGYIHTRSKRVGPLVEHTLGSVPDSLSYSTFLGHTRGAYTGAVGPHAGVLESAKGGTLFLDEIGLATPDIQRLLLGVLEGRPFTPLGASRPVTINVRLVLATNAEPETLVAEGRWQTDFYYRLGGNFIRLPALADRRMDILPLADLFLRKKLRGLGKAWGPQLSREVAEVFLRAAVLMQAEREVELSDLTLEFLRELQSSPQRSTSDPVVARVHDALRRYGGNKAAAARELGWHRADLYRFLERNPRHTPSGGYSRRSASCEWHRVSGH
jgi:DNA-binding NtrC family response regulator